MEEQITGTFATEQADIGESVVTFACGTDMDEISRSSAKRQELLEGEHQTLIHRILDGYYNSLHKFRWFVLAVVIAGIATCTIFASQLSLPTSSDVSLLPDGNEYQKHAKWTQSLLSTKMVKDAGTESTILWGVTPADTGHHLTPDLWTTLELDDSFDPKSEESQTYLLGFCDRLFSEFGKVEEDYQCPINVSMIRKACSIHNRCSNIILLFLPPLNSCLISGWKRNQHPIPQVRRTLQVAVERAPYQYPQTHSMSVSSHGAS